jgi:hypothetical protein
MRCRATSAFADGQEWECQQQAEFGTPHCHYHAKVLRGDLEPMYAPHQNWGKDVSLLYVYDRETKKILSRRPEWATSLLV